MGLHPKNVTVEFTDEEWEVLCTEWAKYRQEIAPRFVSLEQWARNLILGMVAGYTAAAIAFDELEVPIEVQEYRRQEGGD